MIVDKNNYINYINLAFGMIVCICVWVNVIGIMIKRFMLSEKTVNVDIDCKYWQTSKLRKKLVDMWLYKCVSNYRHYSAHCVCLIM